MKYVGLESQVTSNNVKSTLLLVMFPVLILVLVYAFFLLLFTWGTSHSLDEVMPYVNELFLKAVPYVVFVVGVWFVIAYFANTAIIRKSTGARPLERRENKRVYNLVENLCMSIGMNMPQINIIEDDSLNAFASGINDKTFTVTLSRGIIDKLDDEELEGVIAHELTHIRNRDVRLLIVSIVFVGIFSFLMHLAINSLRFSSLSRSRNDKGSGAIMILAVLVLAGVGYLFSTMFRFAISRKREYMADAGAAQMTRKPWALANALKKISEDSRIEAVTRDDVAQLFIEHPMEKKSKSMGISSLFATHPPIGKRIQVLEQI